MSTFGNVRRIGKDNNLVQCRSGKSYLAVSLSQEGSTTNHRVHKLVLETFYGPAPFDGAVIMHNDGNPENNRIKNIRWGTPFENQADRERHGTKTRGSDVKTSKLKEEDIPVIRQRIALGHVQRDIAADYEVDPALISSIKLGRIWKHV